jgi:hypothetical protein
VKEYRAVAGLAVAVQLQSVNCITSNAVRTSLVLSGSCYQIRVGTPSRNWAESFKNILITT